MSRACLGALTAAAFVKVAHAHSPLARDAVMVVVVVELLLAFAVGCTCVLCSIRIYQELSRETALLPYRRASEYHHHDVLETASETEFDVETDHRVGFFSRLFRSLVS